MIIYNISHLHFSHQLSAVVPFIRDGTSQNKERDGGYESFEGV